MQADIEGRIHRVQRDDGFARVYSHGVLGLRHNTSWGVFASDLSHWARAQAQCQQAVSQQAA